MTGKIPAESCIPGFMIESPALVIYLQGSDMEYKNRHFAYNCKCGYSVNVFIDFGKPQEYYKCRLCGSMMLRKDFD